jgi:hypothetical protein
MNSLVSSTIPILKGKSVAATVHQTLANIPCYTSAEYKKENVNKRPQMPIHTKKTQVAQKMNTRSMIKYNYVEGYSKAS